MEALHSLSQQPYAWVVAVAVVVLSLALACLGGSAGVGQRRTCANSAFGCYMRFNRCQASLCAPCARLGKRYPLDATCQIPHFKNLSDIYVYIFGYKTDGLFVEVGAYDGESFSNTSGLADIGWRGHYVEAHPTYAEACRRRHASNAGVVVHQFAGGAKDGETVSLSAAGPFSSAVPDEIASVAGSKMAGALDALSWNPGAKGADTISVKTQKLDTFFAAQKIAPGSVDVMVVDVEGFEWPIFQGFSIKKWKPKTVIVEIQNMQARYRENERAQDDAAKMEAYFDKAGYAIFYRDVINTIFIDKSVRCLGGD